MSSITLDEFFFLGFPILLLPLVFEAEKKVFIIWHESQHQSQHKPK